MHHGSLKVFKPARFFGPVFLLAGFFLPLTSIAVAAETERYSCTVNKPEVLQPLSRSHLPAPWTFSFLVFPEQGSAMVEDPLTHLEFGRAIPAQLRRYSDRKMVLEWELFHLRGRGQASGRGRFTANIPRGPGRFVLNFTSDEVLDVELEAVQGDCVRK